MMKSMQIVDLDYWQPESTCLQQINGGRVSVSVSVSVDVDVSIKTFVQVSKSGWSYGYALAAAFAGAAAGAVSIDGVATTYTNAIATTNT